MGKYIVTLVFSQDSIDGSEQEAVATCSMFKPLTTVRGSDNPVNSNLTEH